MLGRALRYLIDTKDEYIFSWFFIFDGDLTSMTTLDDKFTFSVVCDSHPVVTSWSDFDIISKLESDTQVANATLAAWSFCRFFDVGDDTDTMLREFVSVETGVTLEPVPFTVEKGNLATICDKKYCKGTPKNSENASLRIDNDRLLVILPSTNKALRQLFFKRLRRIST